MTLNSQGAGAVLEMFVLCSSVRKQITSIVNCWSISIIKLSFGKTSQMLL